MSVKASVSISEQQDDYARDLVAQGRYSSLSAVVQHGLDLVRKEDEADLLETAALKILLEERMSGPFISLEEGQKRTEDMIALKKREYGLEA